jgi:hypothetical protein
MALDILYGRGDRKLAMTYLKQCVEICERLVSGKKLRSKRCIRYHPRNLADAYRFWAYSSGIANNTFDETLLRSSLERLEEWCREQMKTCWDELIQLDYLSLLRLSIILADYARAGEFLRIGRLPKDHKLEFTLLKKIIEGRGQLDQSSRVKYESYFDNLRDPEYEWDVLVNWVDGALEIGLIRELCFLSDNRTLNWNRLLQAIAR